MFVIPKAKSGTPISERLKRRVVVTASGCWEWQGHADRYGYGHYNDGPGRCLVHRLMQ